jgi:hypothetical protein
VEEVSIQGSGRGILWAYSQLVAKTVVVSKSLGHALALKQTPQFVLDDLDLLDNLGVGIYVLDSGCTCDDQVCIIKHTFANGNLNGGILAVRSGLCISETSMMDNWIFGLRAVGSAIRLKGFGVAGTRARFDGAWGNGIDAMPDALPSTISVSTGWVVSSERAGIAAIGSLIKLKNTLVQCSAFDLENETVQANDYGPGRPLTIQFGTYDNLGGDFCGCPIAVGTCVSQSAGGPSPPPAIPAQ